MEKKCDKCLEKLGMAVSYVPGLGESCTECLMSIPSREFAGKKKRISSRLNAY